MSFSRAARLFLGLTPAQTRANPEGFRDWTSFLRSPKVKFMKPDRLQDGPPIIC